MSHHIQNWEKNQGRGSQQGQTRKGGKDVWDPWYQGAPSPSALVPGMQGKLEVYQEARLPDQGMSHLGTPETQGGKGGRGGPRQGRP